VHGYITIAKGGREDRMLKKNDQAPDFGGEDNSVVKTFNGERFILSTLAGTGPVYLVFLRGFG